MFKRMVVHSKPLSISAVQSLLCPSIWSLSDFSCSHKLLLPRLVELFKPDLKTCLIYIFVFSSLPFARLSPTVILAVKSAPEIL
jgi:hypothetical protein